MQRDKERWCLWYIMMVGIVIIVVKYWLVMVDEKEKGFCNNGDGRV